MFRRASYGLPKPDEPKDCSPCTHGRNLQELKRQKGGPTRLPDRRHDLYVLFISVKLYKQVQIKEK